MKLVFVDGKYSHAVRVGALLELGEPPPPRPWEKPVSVERAAPTAAQLALAERVLMTTQAAVGSRLFYARIDLLAGHDGEPLLNEVELIDPWLMLRFAPQAADRLTAALLGSASE